MALIIAPENVEEAKRILHSAGETVWHIGTIRERDPGAAQTIIE
jgi:phosphoribosylformylglycinamidine cyclo-ligase